ncbi:MAG: aspartate aminotransferase family protein [Sarcina sp.]
MFNKEDYYKYLINNYKVSDIIIDHGIGSCLYDIKGKKYIDFTSGIAVNSLGYGNEEITTAIYNQASKIIHNSNLFINENTIETAKLLVELSNLDKVFFANSGAESNECAIKIARKYSYDKYGAFRNKILTLKDSFHGRTITTLKATGQEKFHQYFYPFTEGFIYGEANNVENLKEIIKENTDICAIMIELIQCEGGVIELKSNYIKELREICNNKDILLIIDEVQTGIGRTGKVFAYEHYEIKPDILTLAKALGNGIPIGAVVCNKKTSSVLSFGDHGSTFGGNPLATAVAKVVLNKISNKEFLREVNEKSQYILRELNNIESDNIIELRGKGLIIGIEVKGNLNNYIEKAKERGLLLLTAGKNTLRLLPPLIITREEIKKSINILKEIL